MEILRNLWRRKLRNILTISGIAIGIMAFSTMGAMAEKNNKLIDGGVKYFSDHVTVGDSTSGQFGGGLIAIDKIAKVQAVDGVAAVFPSAGAPGKADNSNFSFGPGDQIIGDEPGSAKYSTFKLTAKTGRIDNIQNGEVALGSDIAKELGKKVGDSLDLPVAPKVARADFVNHTFTVVGVMEKTLTAPDNFAVLSLHDAQRALGDSLPPAVRSQVDSSKLVSGIDVYGKPGVNLDNLAKKINAEVPGVKKEDIHVTIDGNQVSLSAEVKRETENKDGEKLLRSERYFGKAYRSFTLGSDIDDAAAEAKYHDGVLELRLPKKAAASAKRLEIH